MSDKVAPPGECVFSCASRYEKADLWRSRMNFYVNLKVTQWHWNTNLALHQHCSPVGTMPNKYTTKITVKMQKSKMYILRWKFDLDLEVKVKWSNEIKCVSFLLLSKSSNPVLISHQMAEISRFMWKRPWPQFQGHCFDLWNIFYRIW